MIGYNETGVASALRTALTILLVIAGGAGSILTVAAFFGDKWWGLDYAANFRWQMFWVLLFCSILYAMIVKGFVSVVFILAALVNAWLIAPLWLESQSAATGEGGVTVVHVDVQAGVSDTGFVLRWLLNTEADLILVAGTTASRMAPLTAEGSPYSILAAPAGSNRTGIVVLGTEDWPVEAIQPVGLDELVYRITVGANDETIDIVTAWGELGSNSTNANQLSTRLDAVATAVESASHPVTLIGNLGATRWTHGMRAMTSTLSLRDATEGSGYLATSPVSGIPVIGGWLGIPIDIVFMTDEITPLELITGPDIGANHLPITLVVGPAHQP